MKRMTERRVCRSHSGFTLIELLVVIGIIAVLSAILFPVFASAREKARSIACLSNEKQIGLGAMQYIEDYDGSYPMGQYYSPNNYNGTHVLWTDALFPYIKNGHVGDWASGKDGVFHCPSFPSDQSMEIKPSYDVAPNGDTPWDGSGPKHPVLNETIVETPSDKIYMLECGQSEESAGWNTFTAWEWDWTDWTGSDGSHDGEHKEIETNLNHDCDQAITSPNRWAWAQCGMMPRFRHQRTCNAIFFDGHAKAIVAGKMNWYKNIYIKAGPPAAEWSSWYPY